MEVIFDNIPLIGNLKLEHTFYEYDEPILFVCIDNSGNRYLCSCTRLGEQWLIGRITVPRLISMIEKSLTLEEAFLQCDPLFCLQWDGKQLIRLPEISKNAFPRKGAKLRLSKDALSDYYCRLHGESTNMYKASCIHLAYGIAPN